MTRGVGEKGCDKIQRAKKMAEGELVFCLNEGEEDLEEDRVENITWELLQEWV